MNKLIKIIINIFYTILPRKFFTEREYELISICGSTKCFAKR